MNLNDIFRLFYEILGRWIKFMISQYYIIESLWNAKNVDSMYVRKLYRSVALRRARKAFETYRRWECPRFGIAIQWLLIPGSF